MLCVLQDLERQHTHIGVMVEFSIALMSKLDGINRHSFNSFRLRVGEYPAGGRAGMWREMVQPPALSKPSQSAWPSCTGHHIIKFLKSL